MIHTKKIKYSIFHFDNFKEENPLDRLDTYITQHYKGWGLPVEKRVTNIIAGESIYNNESCFYEILKIIKPHHYIEVTPNIFLTYRFPNGGRCYVIKGRGHYIEIIPGKQIEID